MVSVETLRERIVRRAREAGECEVSPAVLGGLVTYCALLERWNRRMNLTSIDIGHMTDSGVDRLIVEPLVASRHIPPGTSRVMDVGSGGGSPAVPMRLSAPHGQWTLTEVRQRKSAFLREVVRTLSLSRVEVVSDLFENVAVDPLRRGVTDVISIRAVRADAPLWEAVLATLSPNGRVIWFTSDLSASPRGLEVQTQRAPMFAVLMREGAAERSTRRS